MAITVSRVGFGQVEPNHLSAQRTGQIYAQLPANKDIKILENGQFVKYDYENGEVNTTGDGEWLLVFNEIKLYESRRRAKDFAMLVENYTPGEYYAISDVSKETPKYVEHNGYGPFKGAMYPRLFKTNIGDIYTTNCFKEGNTDRNAVVGEEVSLSVGDDLKINEDGFLEKGAAEDGDPVFKVVKEYTMPDGQPGVKIQRIK